MAARKEGKHSHFVIYRHFSGLFSGLFFFFLSGWVGEGSGAGGVAAREHISVLSF